MNGDDTFLLQIILFARKTTGTMCSNPPTKQQMKAWCLATDEEKEWALNQIEYDKE